MAMTDDAAQHSTEGMSDIDCRLEATKIARKACKSQHRDTALLLLEYARQMVDEYLLPPDEMADGA
jgi:hypothetical protein